MKKIIFLMAVIFASTAYQASAQSNTHKRDTFGKKVSKFLKQTKKDLEQAGHELGDAIGFDDRVGKNSDLLKVDGTFYMPLYTVDLYKSDSTTMYRTESIRLFKKKYPKAKIMSVAIPQAKWIVEPVELRTEVVGYQRSLSCFIIARDGNEGFINAKFLYVQYKNVGNEYQNVRGKYPLWVRTDVLSPKIYEELSGM